MAFAAVGEGSIGSAPDYAFPNGNDEPTPAASPERLLRQPDPEEGRRSTKIAAASGRPWAVAPRRRALEDAVPEGMRVLVEGRTVLTNGRTPTRTSA